MKSFYGNRAFWKTRILLKIEYFNYVFLGHFFPLVYKKNQIKFLITIQIYLCIFYGQ